MAAPDSPFWHQPLSSTLQSLDASDAGLTGAEAKARLGRYGPNLAAPPPGRRLLARIGRRLIEPLVLILLIAGAIAGISGDVASFVIISLIVALSVTLDVVQERRAEATADALRRQVALSARVRRDGALVEIPVEQVVPGDVLELSPGELVPADGLLLAARDAHVNEALLTGEVYPVEKKRADAAEEGALYAGTAFVSGSASMVAVLTGPRTRFGAISAALEAEAPPTAFQIGVRRLGVLIVRLTTFLVLFVLLAHLVFARPPLESFLFAVALAVGLTPELLPMVMTVTLSRGAARMAARQVVVKRLAAIHDLGAMNVLCTDKTGTLTEARITLAGTPDVSGADSARVLEMARANAGLAAGVPGPLDAAILAGGGAGAWQRMDEVPFDFERRCASVLAGQGEERLLITKGGPEAVLSRCASVETPDGPRPLDDAMRARIAALEEEKAGAGLRMLAVAVRPFGGTAAAREDEQGLCLVGFCLFEDPPKPSAGEAIRRLTEAGVRVKVISGDAAPVVAHLARTLGMKRLRVLTGPEMEGMPSATLARLVLQVDLFARISPEGKLRIIRALQKHGATVGFMGDGINDAPAIHAADAGISVQGATDVAQAAADLILLQPDLGVLADGLMEGRRTYGNIMKYIRMGTSSNFGNMLSMALASIAIPFLPLTPVQVLLNNLLYDFSETGIPFDTVDEATTARPHGWQMAPLLRFTLVMGALSSAFDMATFALLVWVFQAGPEVFRTAWFLESMATQILVIFLIRSAGPFWRHWPHPVLAGTSLAALAVAVFLALGPLAPVLGFAPLPGALLGAIGLLVVLYLAAAELLKRVALPRR
ncbi:magnesium-translocating P-type ATPase [Rhodovarius crocodyli]|uniref:Magnesium-transporting ATPase, P-type 1 n=1 Tax=Rhodovarius crocodyli TaxID=1979269 RepID=A0A437MJ76_9PROT|nr:magnesium-translocating P-type ATPase [Rhodovarius crocodyli]RVT97724.1 magnesium-translocating P-type ATPase [Rhodovarius crocodyli]